MTVNFFDRQAHNSGMYCNFMAYFAADVIFGCEGMQEDGTLLYANDSISAQKNPRPITMHRRFYENTLKQFDLRLKK